MCWKHPSNANSKHNCNPLCGQALQSTIWWRSGTSTVWHRCHQGWGRGFWQHQLSPSVQQDNGLIHFDQKRPLLWRCIFPVQEAWTNSCLYSKVSISSMHPIIALPLGTNVLDFILSYNNLDALNVWSSIERKVSASCVNPRQQFLENVCCFSWGHKFFLCSCFDDVWSTTTTLFN